MGGSMRLFTRVPAHSISLGKNMALSRSEV
jgi:hypothetical protein